MAIGDDEVDRTAEAEPVSQRTQVRRAAMASAIGTTIEWYDFFLYNTAAALVFPHLFFPASTAYAGAMQSFATYFVGFAARPIGAAIFGHWGDRIGRKTTLIITLLVMGLASAVIGIMPGTETIGVAAPLLLVTLRVLQGIAVGGEWSGSVLLTMEWGDQKRRGLLGSFAQVGVPVGLVLGTGGMTLLSATMSEEAFDSWGWRIPFLASLILVAVGLVIRLRILETPMFSKVLEQGKTASAPVAEVIQASLARDPALGGRPVRRADAVLPVHHVRADVSSCSVHHYSKTFVLAAVLVGATVELAAIPFFSHLSDTLGRKKVYTAGAVCAGLFAFPYFFVLTQGGRGADLPRDRAVDDHPRDDVRAAGRADRRKLPDTPAIRRRGPRLPAGIGVRGRTGSAGGDMAAPRDGHAVFDLDLHRRRRSHHRHLLPRSGRSVPREYRGRRRSTAALALDPKCRPSSAGRSR